MGAGYSAVRAQGGPLGCPQLGCIRVIHGWNRGALGVAPLAAVAVDNPSGLSPAVVSGIDGPNGLRELHTGYCPDGRLGSSEGKR